MTKKVTIFLYLIIIVQIVLLLGNSHFILGSIYGLLELPIIVIAIILLIFQYHSRSNTKYKNLLFSTTLFLSFFLYHKVQRIDINLNDKSTQTVSLLTYNLFFKNGYKKRITDEISKTNPDILIVQELTNSWVSKLDLTIGNKYRYKKLFPRNGTRGLGIYSKFPISKSKIHSYCQINKIRVKNKNLIVVNTHLASPAIAVENPENFLSYFKSNFDERVKQWKKIETQLKNEEKGTPIIIAGDLNTMKIESLYRKIRLKWVNLHSKVGNGFSWTFPNTHNIKYPFLTLDYMLHNKNIKGIESKVLKGSSSDHLAVYGKVKI